MKERKNIDVKQSKRLSNTGKVGNPPSPKRYNIKLKSPEDIRRMLSVTLNSLRRGEIEVPVARTLIYGGQVLLQVYESLDLAAQIKELEKRAASYD